ncbi:unnamed protein product [Natator depressus]
MAGPSCGSARSRVRGPEEGDRVPWWPPHAWAPHALASGSRGEHFRGRDGCRGDQPRRKAFGAPEESAWEEEEPGARPGPHEGEEPGPARRQAARVLGYIQVR